MRYTDTSGWYSDHRIGETTGTVKILLDRTTGTIDTIVGAHVFGPEHGEPINICALAIEFGLATREVDSITAAHPTVGSDLGWML